MCYQDFILEIDSQPVASILDSRQELCSRETSNLFYTTLLQQSRYNITSYAMPSSMLSSNSGYRAFISHATYRSQRGERDSEWKLVRVCYEELLDSFFVTVSEVEALYQLFKKLSSSIINDGLIHKEELQLALFRNRNKRNLFADRIFDLFDVKRNGVIDFGEFIRSLGVFHPNAPTDDKVTFAFRLYDLRQTGYIEREEVSSVILSSMGDLSS
ncbi:hypothetical protein SAY87_009917 [Trapa incisa]|uniref:Calcineurin B-like protein n=1 Tax=Trapa incisa TaxID=236973 RepID=A0AAN7JHQ8_9MYRT|nr:hypothetical protein SAY87_009917 [Trapa incisa]